jgi:hypothetical protein
MAVPITKEKKERLRMIIIFEAGPKAPSEGSKEHGSEQNQL